jgi:putative transposase
MAATDPLNRRVVEQMLVGVATRQYVRSLEPLDPEMKSRGTSKSAVSRRFVARTTAQLAAWQSAPLDALHLVALLIDGVHVGDHCLIVALRGR